MNNTYTHLHIIFQIAQIFSLPTPWAFSSINTQTPPKKKKLRTTKNETTDGSNPWSNKAEAYNNLGWLFWDHGDLAQAGYEKRKPWKKKERWEWSVWCVHRKVWKKSRRKKKHFFLIVFNCFFSASDGLVGLSFYSRPFFPGKGGFLWILKPLPNKKNRSCSKSPLSWICLR